MQKRKKQSFAQGIITLMIAQIIIKILGLIYKLYLTNKEGFGDIGNGICSSGFQIYALLLTISSIGVPNTVAKLISEKMSVGNESGANRILKVAFAMFSIIGFCCSVFLFLSSRYIAQNLLQIPEAEITLLVLAPSIFFESITSVLRGFFNAKENMKPTAHSQSIEQISKAVLTIGIVEFISYKALEMVNKTELMAAGANLATTISTFIGAMYLLYCYKEEQKYLPMDRRAYEKETIKSIIIRILIVAMPITITALLGGINKNIDSITVVRGLKNFLSAEEAKRQYGILSGKVETLITLPMSFNIALTTAIVPTIAAAKAKRSVQSVENKIRFSLLLTILIGLPASAGMIIFAQPILNLLFPNANSGAFIFQISSISVIFILLNQTITGILQGAGKQFIPMISLVAGVIVKLIINITLVKINPQDFILGGTAGAAVGSVACYIVAFIINTIFLKKYINIKIDKKNCIIKPILATIIIYIVATSIFSILKTNLKEQIATIIAIAITIVTYIFMILAMKIFNKNEINGVFLLRTK